MYQTAKPTSHLAGCFASSSCAKGKRDDRLSWDLILSTFCCDLTAGIHTVRVCRRFRSRHVRARGGYIGEKVIRGPPVVRKLLVAMGSPSMNESLRSKLQSASKRPMAVLIAQDFGLGFIGLACSLSATVCATTSDLPPRFVRLLDVALQSAKRSVILSR